METKFKINREYKDRLFRLLFGNEKYKENTLALYNALNGTSYTNVDDVDIYTIDDVIYIDMKNDVAFILDSEMNLWEHQSIYNPNMPLRGFMYFGKLYDKYVIKTYQDIYRKKLVTIPTPRYMVFYNGLEERPAVEKSKLADYIAFVRKVQTYKRSANLIEAANRAVDECIKEGILKDILLQHKAEVIELVLTTFNKELHEKYLREDAREEGLAEGREQGIAEGRAEGRANGLVALVKSLSKILPENQLFEAVIANEIYKDVTKEQIEKILMSSITKRTAG